MKFAPRVVLRSMTIQEQILAAIAAGPLYMADLRSILKVEDTSAGQQIVRRHLAALQRRGAVQRIGNRQFSQWALVGYRATSNAATRTSRIVRRPEPPRPPSTDSWWYGLTEEQFRDEYRKRSVGQQASALVGVTR